MNPRGEITRHVRGALERETRINLHRYPIRIDTEGGAVVLEGEVEDIAAKKLALELAAGVEGVERVLDRLRIAGERRGDDAIRDSLTGLLLAQPELFRFTIRVRDAGRREVLRQAGKDSLGEIEFSVADGVIRLEGAVVSHPHREFAGVLAWWTPGRRDVVNALEVRPAYEGRDDEVTEALHIVLDMDPWVDAARIRPTCSNHVVTLEGDVRNEEERRRAELDAWYLHAVDRVVNRLQIRG